MLRDGENGMGWRGKCHGMERKMLRPAPSVPRGAADSSGEASVSYSPHRLQWDRGMLFGINAGKEHPVPCPEILTASAKGVRGSSSPGLDGQRGVNRVRGGVKRVRGDVNRVREGVNRVREGVNRVMEDINVCSEEGEMQGSAQLGYHEPLLGLLRALSGFFPRNLGAHIAHKSYGVASRPCWECQGPALHGMLGVLVGVMVWT